MFKKDGNNEIKSTSHSKYRCQYHIVFAPKYRRKEIYGTLKKDIGVILRKLCEQKGVEIIQAEACVDHVHMLVSIPPYMSVAQFMGYLKGKSSLMIFDRHANLKYMIGYLSTTLEVAGKEYSICSDYRVALVIFEAFDDPELNEYDKMAVMLDCLYKEPDSIPREACNEAIEKASWFLDGGEDYKEAGQQRQKKVMSWSQDEKMIFSAVNKTAGQEVRAVPYMHWWTFLGYFAEIGECLFSTVRSIREKKNRHKKLDKWEQEFYKEHKKMIDIERKYSAQEQAERDALNKLLG